MPTLIIHLPPRNLRKVKIRSRQEGFKTPTDWARFLIERNIGFEESPRLTATKIVSDMEKTGLYKRGFLKELGASLKYADKTA